MSTTSTPLSSTIAAKEHEITLLDARRAEILATISKKRVLLATYEREKAEIDSNLNRRAEFYENFSKRGELLALQNERAKVQQLANAMKNDSVVQLLIILGGTPADPEKIEQKQKELVAAIDELRFQRDVEADEAAEHDQKACIVRMVSMKDLYREADDIQIDSLVKEWNSKVGECCPHCNLIMEMDVNGEVNHHWDGSPLRSNFYPIKCTIAFAESLERLSDCV